MKTFAKLILSTLFILFLSFELFAQNDSKELSFNALEWRFIGPIIGNRGSVVLGHPTKEHTFYHGASNGLWKTEDAGTYWEPVGDKDFKYGSIGAMEISESNPEIMYVGMGEPQMRSNVSWGDGVYKSVDGGENCVNVGLEETHHISQVRIHPTNPDIVYVGAFGHAFGPNPERGVFKTVDGGKTWNKILFKSIKAGVIDLVMNPSNSDELFAAVWDINPKVTCLVWRLVGEKSMKLPGHWDLKIKYLWKYFIAYNCQQEYKLPQIYNI